MVTATYGSYFFRCCYLLVTVHLPPLTADIAVCAMVCGVFTGNIDSPDFHRTTELRKYCQWGYFCNLLTYYFLSPKPICVGTKCRAGEVRRLAEFQ